MSLFRQQCLARILLVYYSTIYASKGFANRKICTIFSTSCSQHVQKQDAFIKVLTDLGSIDNLQPSPHRDEWDRGSAPWPAAKVLTDLDQAALFLKSWLSAPEHHCFCRRIKSLSQIVSKASQGYGQSRTHPHLLKFIRITVAHTIT